MQRGVVCCLNTGFIFLGSANQITREQSSFTTRFLHSSDWNLLVNTLINYETHNLNLDLGYILCKE